MAFSVNTPVGDGVTKQFAVNFTNGIFSRDSVSVFVDGELDGGGNQIERDFIWINDGLIELTGDAPASGATINIRRIMDKQAPAVDFEDGEILNERNLDLTNDQLLNLIHELLDGYGYESLQSDIGMSGNRITGLGDALTGDGATTRDQVLAFINAQAEGLVARRRETRKIASQGQTVFNLADVIYVPAINNIQVYVNGVAQVSSVDYLETNESTITFLSGLDAGDAVDMYVNEITQGTYDPIAREDILEAREDILEAQADLENRVTRVSSRTEMKAYDVPAGYQFSLEEGGRSGLFVVKTGTPPSDPQEGIYVVLDNGNYAERIYDGPLKGGWFGADATSSTNTTALQALWDFVSAKGVGGAQVEHEYEIESPLDLTKGNIRDRINVVLSGPGAIKKATSFTGDRLINIASDDFDEDNLILFHLSIDGVDKSVNGVDFFDENEPFDSNPTTATNTVYSKAVRFDNCNFNNCYRGARVTGNSNTFASCTFWQNACGTFNTAAANDIRYIGCSFRRGGVGAHIRTASASLGTVGTQFVGCIFESNAITGLALEGRPNDVGLHGFYFENNGFNLASTDYTSMSAPAEPCHIYSFGTSNGGGLTTLASGEFWPSPAGVVHVYGTQISRFAFINTPATVKSTNIFAENTAVGKFDVSSVDLSAASLSQSEALLTINDKSYYAIGTTLKEFFPAELFQIGPSSTTTVATTNINADVYEIVAENGANNAVKLIAHRGSSTVVEMALMGTATGKPTAAWSGDNLQVTAGTAATNRVVVTKVMIR